MREKLYFIFLFTGLFLVTACSDNSETKSQPNDKVVIEKQIKTANEKSEAPSQIANNCVLNMGWDPWAPYQYLTPENEVKGLEIELVLAIAKGADCQINFVQKSWMDLLHGIRSGSIDLLAGASKTTARERFAYFSDNYRHESFIIYVRSGEGAKFDNKNLKQLLNSGFKIGVTEDYIYGDKVTKLQDDPAYAKNFIYVPMTEVNYYNLLQNKTDGFLEDPFVAAYTIRSKGLQDQIEAYPIEIHSGDVSLMFSKKSVDPATVEAFNQSLKVLKMNGEYNKIVAKYSR